MNRYQLLQLIFCAAVLSAILGFGHLGGDTAELQSITAFGKIGDRLYAMGRDNKLYTFSMKQAETLSEKYLERLKAFRTARAIDIGKTIWNFDTAEVGATGPVAPTKNSKSKWQHL